MRYSAPDWHSQYIPQWEQHLAPLRDRCVRMLEVGSYEGRSAVWMAEHLLGHPESTLTCVDPLYVCPVYGEDPPRNLIANIEETGLAGRIKLCVGFSSAVLPRLMAAGERFDFVYIDGSHEARDVLFDGVMALEMLRDGGLLAFDDYLWADGGLRTPRPAIDALFAVNHGRLRPLSVGGQVWFEKVAT